MGGNEPVQADEEEGAKTAFGWVGRGTASSVNHDTPMRRSEQRGSESAFVTVLTCWHEASLLRLQAIAPLMFDPLLKRSQPAICHPLPCPDDLN